ncbi:Hypothetical predicted protein [Paramuricea clavata]|uniref:Uncharacterized protein n=1 Tax=Paramuricea clavata TaxID=317549 RepID=A0A6S7HBY5_PARCT|nr:Hypothetical predicted protein [Paramuricea clavata]
MLGSGSLIDIFGGSYHFLSCHFFQNVPEQNPNYAQIHTGNSTKVTFENCSYEIYPIAETSRNGNSLNSNMFYVLSYDSNTITFQGAIPHSLSPACSTKENDNFSAHALSSTPRSIQHVSLKNVFVSHRGQDEDNCGNWTMPCRSVRHAVNISSANDVIHIDYAEGRPYKECEHPIGGNQAIMLDKSLSFYGFNGSTILHCEQTYPFFEINSQNLKNCSAPKIVFSNLSLASRGTLFYAFYAISSTFELEFNFCDIERSLHFVEATSLSCSIQVFNSNIRSSRDPIYMLCGNLTARLIGSTFFSCSTYLISNSNYFSNQVSLLPYETVLNVHIYNCSFIPMGGKQSCTWFLSIVPSTGTGNITIKSSIFLNFNNHVKILRFAALSIHSGSPLLLSTNIVLDKLHFENINSGPVVHLQVETKQCHVSIFNSMFVNTTTALVCKINICTAKLYNVTFNSTHSMLGSGGMISLLGRVYHLSSCHFFQNVPVQNPSYPLIRTDGSTKVTFENCSYEIYPAVKTSRNGNVLSSNMFYFLSYDATAINDKGVSLFVKGYFTMLCPPGYRMNLNVQCYNSADVPVFYRLFTASCEQCPRKTYSFHRGEVQNHRSNHITCHECPVGGKCVEGKVTSKPNFWGYKSNEKVEFLQCPPKYCCDTDHCENYNSCHGNRMGTLCGECPSGMSESLFDTKCKPNKDCTSVTFWPAISAYLTLYLLFFLYHGDIVNFLRKRFIPLLLPSGNGRDSKSGGLLKIIFYYYQIIHLLRNTVRSDAKVKLLDDIETFLFKSFNFLIIGIPSIDCPFQDLRPVQKTVIVHSVGYSLLTLLCLLYLSTFVFKVVKKLRARSTQEMVALTEAMHHSPNLEDNPFLGRTAGAFACISLLMYASSTQLCLSLLHCVPVRDNKVLFLDGNIQCYQTFQYFLLAYMISSILPFCLVPVLGSYLLKFGPIGVKQFCAACVFPLPFCCFWMYLLLKYCRCGNQGSYNTIENDDAVRSEQDNDETQSLGSENTFTSSTDRNETTSTRCESAVCTDSNKAPSTKSESAIRSVLLGPFRPHQAFLCFPSSHIPWEGFLIFRRLVLIIVLTFVYDIQLRLFAALILCVAILICHTIVYPFQRKRDNVLESFSLGTHVVLCGSTLIKALHYGEDYSSFSKTLPVLNVIESILIVAPLSIIMIVVIFSLAIKLVFGLKLCVSVLIRKVRGILRFT